MKILHAHKYYYPRAGAERYMLDLMAMQEEAGHTVAPFAMHYPKNLSSPWSDYFVSELKTEKVGRGLGAVKQAMRAFWSREAEQKMGKMLDAFQPDVVHIHNIYTHFSPSILRPCKQRGIPVVMTVHDHALVSANHAAWNGKRPLTVKELGPFSVAKTRFIKGSYLATLVLALIHEWHLKTGAYTKNISRFLAISNYMKRTMIERGFPEEKIQVQYNFVAPECTPRQKQTNGVFFLGRLEDYKGVQTLIEAMKTLPHAELRIAGSGNYEDHLMEQSSRMSNVSFLGHLDKKEIGEELSTARVAVFPSLLNEPFGLAAVEAMACATPVIVSNRGGLQEVVEDGVSGRVFEAGDSKELASILQEFLTSGPYAESIGEAGKLRAEEISDPEKHLESIIKVYKEVIAQLLK
jgi:glycosyltransferase involved in cell wall biosynthesis